MILFNRRRRATVFFYYSVCIVFFIAGILGVIGSFNIWMDYSGVFGLSGKVPSLSLGADNRRLLLPAVIRQSQPDCIIAGTSRVGRGIDPQHPALREYNCLNVYLNAGDAFEVAKVVQYAVETANIKLVLLGVDFFMFDVDLDVPKYSKNFRPGNFSNTPLSYRIFENLDLITSGDALKQNISQFLKFQGKRDIGTSRYIELQNQSFVRTSGLQILPIDAWYEMGNQLWNLVDADNGGHGYGQFELSHKKLEAFVNMLQVLTENNITFVVFMNPTYVTFIESIFSLGLDSAYKKIVKRIAKYSKEPSGSFYDFNGFNKVNTEYFSLRTSGCFSDGGHYASDVGDAMISIMIDGNMAQDKTFGVRLFEDNMESYFSNVDKQRLLWKKNHRRDFQIVQEIIKCSLAGESNLCVESIVNTAFEDWPIQNFSKKQIFNNMPTYKIVKGDCVKLQHSVEAKVAGQSKKNSNLLSDLMSRMGYSDSSGQTVNQEDFMAHVPAGEFLMGAKEDQGYSNELPMHKIYLESFYMDRAETTNKQFWELVYENMDEFEIIGGVNTNLLTENANDLYDMLLQGEEYFDRPVINVTWAEAKVYCELLGKRLPTEAEWEKAARGLKANRYPWGNEWPKCDRAIITGSGLGAGCGKGHPWKVRSKPLGISPYGIFDMIGNVSEYVEDTYDHDFYRSLHFKNPVNYLNPGTRVTRGGSWSSERYEISVTRRIPAPEDSRSETVGFRCAKSAKSNSS